MSLKLCILINSAVIIQCTAASVIIYVSLKKANTATLYSLSAFQSAIALWLFFEIIGNTAGSTSEFLILVRFTLVPVNFIGGLWLFFSLCFIQYDRISKKLAALLIFTPLVILLVPLLPIKLFYLITKYKAVKSPAITVWRIRFVINLTFTYLYFFIGAFLIVRNTKKFEHIKKSNCLLLISSFFTPMLTNIFTAAAHIINAPGFDLLPAGFSLTTLLLSIAVFKTEFLNVSVLANNNIFNYMEKATIIIDSDNNIIDYNKSARNHFIEIFDFKKTRKADLFFLSFRKYAESKEKIDNILSHLEKHENRNYKDYFCLKIKPDNIKHITLDAQPIKNDNGNRIGEIITMDDVLSSSNIPLEYERDRFSQILHDHISPNVVRVLQTIQVMERRYAENKDITGIIKESLDQAHTAAEALRNVMRRVSPVNIKANGLKNALLSLFSKTKIYEIEIWLEYKVNADINNSISKNEIGQIIYTICEQAIDNTYYHCKNKNKCINITIEHIDGTIYLFIFDNGAGCDKIVKNRGLLGMEEKIRSINGQITFRNPSDGGFTISAIIPFKGELIV